MKCKGLDVRDTDDLHILVDNLIQNLAVNYHLILLKRCKHV